MAITPLTTADRVAHLGPPGGLQPYEWWYFEVHARIGADDWIVVLSAHHPHALDPVRMLDVHFSGALRSPRFTPGRFSGVDVSVYRIDDAASRTPGLVALGVTRTHSAVATDTSPFSASFGAGPVLTITEAPSSPRVYTLTLRQPGAVYRSDGIIHPFAGAPGVETVDLELDLTFEERSPGFKHGTGEILLDAKGGSHHWAVVMPDALVNGTLRVGSVTVALSGATGYHDHQWGPNLPMHMCKEWSWGRAVTPAAGGADVLLFFQTRARGTGVEKSFAAFVPAGGVAQEIAGTIETRRWTNVAWPVPDQLEALLNTFGGLPRLAMLAAVKVLDRLLDARPSLGKVLGYWQRIRIDGTAPTGTGSATESWVFDADQEDRSVEPWPFYNRYLPGATLARAGAPSVPGFTLTEFMQPSELIFAARPRVLPGVRVPLLLLGIAVFSEAVTHVEPGAPRLWELI